MSKVKITIKKSKVVLVILLIVILFYLFFKNISSSVFLKNKDRINVVFYSQNTSYFSLSNQDVNYLIKFPPNLEVLVPGGYGSYKIGALGKLVSLEKKPEIFKRTFSSTTSTFVDLYFFPTKTQIYYEERSKSYFPSFLEILLSKSNANFFDRLFLTFKLFDRNQSNYRSISKLPLTKEDNKLIFDKNQFNKDFQGSFYKKSFRSEKTTVQLIYEKSYSTAYLISQIIDGEGIRVVDLSQTDEKIKGCELITKKTNFVADSLADFFNCNIKVGETTISDIIIKIGNLEKDWAMK